MTPEIKYRLEDMRRYAEEALSFVGALSNEAILGDRECSYAIAYTVQTVGEAASKIPDIFRERNPEIDWYPAINLRHRIVHAYRTLLLPIVLNAVRNEFPRLIAEIDRILAEGGETP